MIHSKERIIEDMDGDEDLLRTIVHLCLEELPNEMNLLKESIDQRDGKKLEFVAHTIKGMAKQFGVDSAGELALQLEQKGKNDDFTEVETLLPMLLTELDSMTGDMKDLLK